MGRQVSFEDEPTPVGIAIDELMVWRLKKLQSSNAEIRVSLDNHIARDELELKRMADEQTKTARELATIRENHVSIVGKLGETTGHMSAMVVEMGHMRRIAELQTKGDITERHLRLKGQTKVSLKLIALVAAALSTATAIVTAIVKYG